MFLCAYFQKVKNAKSKALIPKNVFRQGIYD
jgi:hypothetical protein